MHNKEQHEQHEFYKSLAEALKEYDEVVLLVRQMRKLNYTIS